MMTMMKIIDFILNQYNQFYWELKKIHLEQIETKRFWNSYEALTNWNLGINQYHNK